MNPFKRLDLPVLPPVLRPAAFLRLIMYNPPSVDIEESLINVRVGGARGGNGLIGLLFKIIFPAS